MGNIHIEHCNKFNGDWVVISLDGSIIYEGREIDFIRVLKDLGYDVKVRWL